MKLLFIASSIERKYNPFLDAIKKFYNADVVYYPDHELTIIDKILFKVLYHPTIKQYNRKIENKIKDEFYDLAIVVKGSYITPKSTKLIKNRCKKLVYWSNDDIARKHNRTKFLKKSLKFYDVVYTMKILNVILNQLKKFGCLNVEYLLQCYSEDLVVQLKEPRIDFLYDVVFIGRYEEERAKTIELLANSGIKVDVFGNGWKDFAGKMEIRTLRFHKPVMGKNYAETIKKSKIALCFLRKINLDTITVRSMEIPAYGGFCLGEYSVEHSYLLKNKIEAVWFKNNTEAVDLVSYYLKNCDEREKITLAGNKKIKEWNCTYEDQARYIVQG